MDKLFVRSTTFFYIKLKCCFDINDKCPANDQRIYWIHKSAKFHLLTILDRRTFKIFIAASNTVFLWNFGLIDKSRRFVQSMDFVMSSVSLFSTKTKNWSASYSRINTLWSLIISYSHKIIQRCLGIFFYVKLFY